MHHIDRFPRAKRIGEHEAIRAEITQQAGDGLEAIDPALELADAGAERGIRGQMAIDVFHGRT